MSWGQSNAGSQAAALQQQQQNQVTQATGQINKAFSGFTPDFFNNYATSYENYATPQLYGQFQTAGNQLADKLGNQDLTNSSAAQQEYGALDQSLNQGKQQIASTARSGANSLQQQVANEQANLISQANAASNPLSVAQGAVSTAAGLQTQSPFSPIGGLFQNFANTYLGSQLSNTYNPGVYSAFLSGTGGGTGGSYGSGLPSTQQTIQ